MAAAGNSAATKTGAKPAPARAIRILCLFWHEWKLAPDDFRYQHETHLICKRCGAHKVTPCLP